MKKIIFLLFIPFLCFSQQKFEYGKSLFERSEFDSAHVVFSELISGYKGKFNDTTLALYKTYLGKVYHMQERYDLALQEFEQAITLMDSAHNYNGKAFAMISLAESYRRMVKLNDAERDFSLHKGEKILAEVLKMHVQHPLNKYNEAYLYNRFAAILQELSKEEDKVVLYSNKTIEIADKYGYSDLTASSLNELGFHEENKKEYTLAANYYKKSFDIEAHLQNRIYMASVLTNLARIHLRLQEYKKSEQYADQALKLIDKTDWINTKTYLYDVYSQALFEQHKYKEARDAYIWHSNYLKASSDKSYSKALLEIESKYELTKKAAQIEKEKQELKLSESKTALRTQERNYVVEGAVVLLLLVFLLFFSYKKIKRTNVLLSSSLQEREMLLKEVNHRVKNNLQVVSSLLDLQAEHMQDETARRQLLESKNRLNSIAQVHELMYSQESFARLNVKDYFSYLAEEIKNSLWEERLANVEVSCENIEMSIAEAISLGILLNELLTNSFKHAKPGGNLLEILIVLNKRNNEIKLDYRDNGRNYVPSDQGRIGIGATIINSMVRQLHGASEIIYTDGFQFKLLFEIRANGKNSYR
jgi:two-component sensor histidine kinase